MLFIKEFSSSNAVLVHQLFLLQALLFLLNLWFLSFRCIFFNHLFRYLHFYNFIALVTCALFIYSFIVVTSFLGKLSKEVGVY